MYYRILYVLNYIYIYYHVNICYYYVYNISIYFIYLYLKPFDDPSFDCKKRPSLGRFLFLFLPSNIDSTNSQVPVVFLEKIHGSWVGQRPKPADIHTKHTKP